MSVSANQPKEADDDVLRRHGLGDPEIDAREQEIRDARRRRAEFRQALVAGLITCALLVGSLRGVWWFLALPEPKAVVMGPEECSREMVFPLRTANLIRLDTRHHDPSRSIAFDTTKVSDRAVGQNNRALASDDLDAGWSDSPTEYVRITYGQGNGPVESMPTDKYRARLKQLREEQAQGPRP